MLLVKGNYPMIKYLLIALVLGGCSGTAMEHDSSGCGTDPAPICDRETEEPKFSATLLHQTDACNFAGTIDTCLTPETSCAVCMPVRCCDEMSAYLAIGDAVSLDEYGPMMRCKQELCPVCDAK